MRLLHRLVPLTVAVLLASAGTAAAASPVTTTSTNWSGYAATGAHFRQVTSAWRVPTVDCSAGTAGWTANWVGLGGYSTTSQALEQTGTESDCTPAGRARYSAWWEVVPDVSHSARLSVRAGDRIVATVTVVGRRVTMRLANTTRHVAFTRTLTAQAVDVTSAEWVLEAPATCASTSAASCSVLPLAPFGTSAFSGARATTTGGHRGTISDPRWSAVAIALQGSATGARRDVGADAAGAGATATPSALSASGGGFSIAYGEGATTPTGDPGATWELGRDATSLPRRAPA